MVNVKRKDLPKLIMLCGSSFFIHTSFALPGPILPLEAREKGIPLTWTGLIFGIHDVVRLLTSPFSGSIIAKLGPRFILTFGMFLEGLMQLLFGFSEYIFDKDFFVGYCLIIRGAIGFGNVLSIGSILTIAVDEFDTGAVGWISMCNAIGFLSSPYFGGVLYKYFGFQMPFTVSAVPILGCSIIIAAYNRNGNTKIRKKIHAESLSFLDIIIIPDIFLRAIPVIMLGYVEMFYVTTLADHLLVLTNYTINADEIGLVFMSHSIGFCFAAPLVDIVHRRLLSTRASLVIGMFLYSILVILIGHCSEFTPFIVGFTWLHIFLFFLGFFYAFSSLSAIYDMKNCARGNGLPDSVAVSSQITTIYMFGLILGKALSSCISPYLVERLSFIWASTAVGIFYAAIVLAMGMASEVLQRKGNVAGS